MPNSKRKRFPTDGILVCIRWYAAHLLHFRHLGKNDAGAVCWPTIHRFVQMIRKGQFMMEDCDGMSFADQFSTLAAQVRSQ